MELSDQSKTTDAINAYRKAIEADPDFSNPSDNLGLIYKYRLDWRNSLKYNLKAAQLDPASPGEPSASPCRPATKMPNSACPAA